MQRPGLSYRNAGIGSLSGDDPYLSGIDSPVLHSPEDYIPGPNCQPLDQDGISNPGATSMSEYPRDSMLAHRRPDRSFLGAPLNLRAMTGGSMSMPEISYKDRAGTDSPTNQMHFVPTPPFPTLRHSSMEEPTSSPRTERLPSFRQLSKIADGGTEATESRATSSYPALPAHPPTMTSQSPVKSLPYFTGSQQSSPTVNFNMLSHPSPTMARIDHQDTFVVPPSPASYPMPDQGRFASRRRSFGSANPPTFAPSMTSSSNETTSTVSHQSSGADSLSTANTTPTESMPFDAPPSLSMPPTSGLQQSPPAGGVFTCEYPGCTSAPFQTQYLLNSHANVHSSNRPHYCPVKGCPRGEGGKGFKRKNEMIRHGLVHDSPGYICPFCPLREHRYPRPDNLQRHVRVHHVDKDKDDALLREVLSQRPEGGSRGRRRRTGP